MSRWLYRPEHPEANENGMVLLQPGTPGLGLYVITDEMPATRHMADGTYFTSKAKFRAHTKATGHYEIGNELPTMTKPREPVKLDRRQRREDIQRTIHGLRNGTIRPPQPGKE